MPKPTRSDARYMPGLDGIRAVAVMAVVIYHLNTAWAPGGLLGVGVFFVLSGYLITDLLANEYRRTGRLHLRGFWARRFRRLIPALWLMIGMVCLWMALADPGRLSKLGGDIGAAFLYVSNWWYIFHQVSYFDRFGPPTPFGHLWSLAVEEQFYLVWPLLLLWGMRRLSRRGLLGAVLVGVLASALAMALLFQPGVDPSRVYYGTDTRAFGLLVGAALALVWPSDRLGREAASGRWGRSGVGLGRGGGIARPGRGVGTAGLGRGVVWLDVVGIAGLGRGGGIAGLERAVVWLDVVGIAGLVAIVAMVVLVNEYSPFLYRGGMLLLSLASAATIACAAHPGTRLGRWLGAAPLRWIGVRSYGIYLWHYPVIVLTTPLNTAGVTDWLRVGLQVVTAVVLAALSWRYVEQPILARDRRGSGIRADARVRGGRRGRRWAGSIPWIATTSALVLAGALWFAPLARASLLQWTGNDAVGGMHAPRQPAGLGSAAGAAGAAGAGAGAGAMARGAADAQAVGSGAMERGAPEAGVEGTGHGPGEIGSGAAAAAGEAGVPGVEVAPSGAGAAGSSAGAEAGTKPGAGTPTNGLAQAGNGERSGVGITAIGDSVLEDAKPYLEADLPGVVIDAKVGRQFTEASGEVRRLEAAGKLGSTVILELGNNGPFTTSQLDALLGQLAGRRVVLVTVRVPRPWQDVVNRTISAAAERHPGVRVVDWFRASAGKTGWFYEDGVHLNAAGSKVYAAMLADACREG
ncbi:acyltransferase family protein [Alicyclobacillus sp.]|uniref:acyltransferase family protein n=1 Tax=Alicyclobacillus sp. TaxID=61169 RepID=UPI0025B81C24|nr:acyltransferase family protein [Alicyclobacillus sp.]MCL6517993.1 acyltransferase [Alicyclobacillus sp.]